MRAVKAIFLSLLAAASILGGVTAAEASKPIKKAKFALDPSMGYIMARVGPVSGKGTPKQAVYLARLDPATGQTLWSFGNAAINGKNELDVAMLYGSSDWATDGHTTLYVVPVNPGKWVVGGANVTTFSLGSYGFDVKPGEITYVGTILAGPEDGKSPVPQVAASKLSPDLLDFGVMMNIVMSDTMVMIPPSASDPVPSGYKLTRAVLKPDVRFNNFMKSLIGRAASLPPMTRREKEKAVR